MRILKRWTDQRRIRTLRRDWETFRAVVEAEFGMGESGDEPTPGTGVEDRFIPGFDLGALRSGGRSAEMTSVAEERRFLTLKAQTARSLPALAQVGAGRELESEAVAAAREMNDLLNRVATLADAKRLSPAERASFTREWHVIYLFLARLEGALTGSSPAGVALDRASTHIPRGSAFRFAAPGPSRTRWGRVTGGLVEAAILIGLVWLAASLLGINAANLRSALSGRPASHPVEGVGVAQAPTGETEVTAPPAPASAPVSTPAAVQAGASSRSTEEFKFRMPRIVQPVFIRYGTVGVFVLFGAFVSGLLLLFGARSR
jgi:hypothetical protein